MSEITWEERCGELEELVRWEKGRAEKAEADLKKLDEHHTLVCDDRLNIWNQRDEWKARAEKAEDERGLSRLKSAAAILLLEKAEKEGYLLREVVAAADAWLVACDSGAPLLDTHGNGFRDVARESYRAARAKLGKT